MCVFSIARGSRPCLASACDCQLPRRVFGISNAVSCWIWSPIDDGLSSRLMEGAFIKIRLVPDIDNGLVVSSV